MTVIEVLLKNRGLRTEAARKKFFSPENPQKIDWRQLGINSRAVTVAVNLIQTAVKTGRPVYIYGDYDADGICSTAILWETLYRLKAKVMPYIAPRHEPVRGLSVAGLKRLPSRSLVITVDNGITGFAAAKYAQKTGIDLIITDHHSPAEASAKLGRPKFPPAAAVVHSTQLAGAGVAWFLARELGGRKNLDLAAIGTVADMVPLLGANRSLVKFGLDQLRQTSRPGIKALLALAKIDIRGLTPHQISFSLAPRLNAIGRLADSLDALRLLCTQDSSRAQALAETLTLVNQQRQDKTLSMWQHARRQVKLSQKIIFAAAKSYHEGLVGLVAGRLAEEFHRPAFVVAIGPKHVKGSCRSLKAFNAIEAIRQLGDLVLERGGHPLAAGFTASPANLPAIRAKLEQAAARLTEADFRPEAAYEAELTLDQVNGDLFKQLARFEPFGFGNPQPQFLAKKVKLISFYPVGQEAKHLKLKLPGFAAIAFGQGRLAQKLKPGQLVDIIYSLEANNWNNHQSLELKIKEITILP
jgi:single-stranded-DNA-specific exonuclease